jgi:hypothetical protein
MQKSEAVKYFTNIVTTPTILKKYSAVIEKNVLFYVKYVFPVALVEETIDSKYDFCKLFTVCGS